MNDEYGTLVSCFEHFLPEEEKKQTKTLAEEVHYWPEMAGNCEKQVKQFTRLFCMAPAKIYEPFVMHANLDNICHKKIKSKIIMRLFSTKTNWYYA